MVDTSADCSFRKDCPKPTTGYTTLQISEGRRFSGRSGFILTTTYRDGEPYDDKWVLAHGIQNVQNLNGVGFSRLTVLEVIPSTSFGSIIVYRIEHTTPDGEPYRRTTPPRKMIALKGFRRVLKSYGLMPESPTHAE